MKNFHFAFVDLEKAFQQDVVWWALRKLGIEEWLVKIVESTEIIAVMLESIALSTLISWSR